MPVKSKNHDETHSLQGTHKLMANTCITITQTAFLVHKMNHWRMQRYIHENTIKLKWHALKHFSLLTVRFKSRFYYIFHSISMRQKFYLRKYSDTITPRHIQRKTNSELGSFKSITWQNERTHATRNSKCQGSTFQLDRVIAEETINKTWENFCFELFKPSIYS